jgi:hypothetical protein
MDAIVEKEAFLQRCLGREDGEALCLVEGLALTEPMRAFLNEIAHMTPDERISAIHRYVAGLKQS